LAQAYNPAISDGSYSYNYSIHPGAAGKLDKTSCFAPAFYQNDRTGLFFDKIVLQNEHTLSLILSYQNLLVI
jgi:hypothetical protein